MPKRKIFEDKKCIKCGKIFNRGILPSGRLEGSIDYEKRKFCCHKCFSDFNTKERHVLYKGGIKRSPEGYLRYSENDKFVHRVTMEQFIKRNLRKDEFINHVNGDKTDNRIQNLVILSNSEHRKIHAKMQNRNKDGRW